MELGGDLWCELWRDFVDDFGFSRSRTPVINEPVPSVVWALPDFRESARPVAQLVNDVLRECVEYWDFLGAPAVTKALALNDGVLTKMARRDGKPPTA